MPIPKTKKKKMISKRELIYNMEIIGDKNMIINGSLLSEIERIMEEYA